MAGLLSYIAAGATQGVGEGIVASGAARRQAALAQYSQDREDARFQAGQNDVSTTFTDDQGNVNTVARGGLVRNTGVKAAVKTTADNKLVQVYDPKTKTITYKPETEASGMQAPPKIQAQPLPDRTLVPVWDPQKKANVWKPRSEAVGMEPAHTASQTNNEGGLTEADNRLWEIVTKKHTTKDPDTGDTTTDWAAVQKDLSARGRKDLADLAGDPPAAEVPPPEGNPASKEDNTGYGDGTDPETNPALQKPKANVGGQGDLNANFQRNQPYVKQGAKNFATTLTPDGEKAFRAWVQKNNVPFDPEAKGPQDYDMRGFYAALMSNDPQAKSAVDPNDKRLHYPDYWKTPYHATFSNESQWATPDAPKWNDKDQLVDKSGKVLFDDRAANQAKSVPKGTGTQGDPYRPTTQAEFNSIPPNTVYLNPKDQKLYKKTGAPGK